MYVNGPKPFVTAAVSVTSCPVSRVVLDTESTAVGAAFTVKPTLFEEPIDTGVDAESVTTTFAVSLPIIKAFAANEYVFVFRLPELSNEPPAEVVTMKL